ncbi:MAG: ABC transporter permease [Thermoguttaceae bacterium]|nr:ABC transporter permease [Thermoguttaceae bacterium]MDW8037401.1 ABC transporter permease [Thermoguttaceae bacterium]
MTLMGFAWKNLRRRPVRTVLTMLGVGVAVGAVVALVGLAGSFEQALLDLFQRRGVDLVVIRRGGLQQMNSILDEKLAERIQQIPGVRAVSPGLLQPFSFPEVDIFGVIARGMRSDSFLLKDLNMVEGRLFGPNDHQVVVLGSALAASLGKKVGDRIELAPGHWFTILGVYESENLLENGTMIMPLSDLQQMMDLQGKVTAFNVVADLHTPEQLQHLKSQIEALAPYLRAQTLRENVASSVELQLAKATAWLTSAVALIVGGLGMINTMLTAVFERTRELALLRAVGWRRGRLMRLVLLEAVLLALAGAVVGTLLGWSLTQLLSRIPAAGRMVAGQIPPTVVLKGFALALGVGVLGGLYPAYRAAQLLPTEGLRHE